MFCELFIQLTQLTLNRLNNTGEFTKRVREMSSQLFVTLYTLSIYTSAIKQLRRQTSPKPFSWIPLCFRSNNLKQDTNVKLNFLINRRVSTNVYAHICEYLLKYTQVFATICAYWFSVKQSSSLYQGEKSHQIFSRICVFSCLLWGRQKVSSRPSGTAHT